MLTAYPLLPHTLFLGTLFYADLWHGTGTPQDSCACKQTFDAAAPRLHPAAAGRAGFQRSAMAPQIPTQVRGALAQAKRVLGIVMRLKTSKILFNEPVDPVALGLDDYLDKVSSPMDFGTIMSRLQEGEKAGWKKCHYLKTENVLRDVQLVFANCFAYNDGPGDEVTRELCSEVKANFEKRWREASLPLESVVEGSQAPSVPPEAQPVDWMGESDVPAELSYVQGAACFRLRDDRDIFPEINSQNTLRLQCTIQLSLALLKVCRASILPAGLRQSSCMFCAIALLSESSLSWI